MLPAVIEAIRSGRHKANSSVYQLLNPNADAKSKKDILKGLGVCWPRV